MSTSVEHSARPEVDEAAIKVDYLAAAAPFHGRLPEDEPIENARAASMTFFGVADRQERDTYHYFLEIDGVRITDTSIPIRSFLKHGHELHANLVEQITPGAPG